MTDNINEVMDRLERGLERASDLGIERTLFGRQGPGLVMADLKALLSYTKQCREALERQTDNMAFVINHVELGKWGDKFEAELAEDRQALSTQPGERE